MALAAEKEKGKRIELHLIKENEWLGHTFSFLPFFRSLLNLCIAMEVHAALTGQNVERERRLQVLAHKNVFKRVDKSRAVTVTLQTMRLL